MLKPILAVTFSLFLASAAGASSGWLPPDDDGLLPSSPDICANTDDSVKAVAGDGVKPGRTLYHCATSTNTGDSPIFEVARQADLTFDPDINGTSGTARIYIQKCVDANKSSNTCSRIIMDANADGVIDTSDVAGSELDGDNGETANNGRFVFQLNRGYYYVEFTAAPGAGEEAVTSLEGY